jgi:hypothetical protein
MKTFKAICLTDTIFSEDGLSLSLKCGNEYIISPPDDDNTVTVFSSCWASGVPASLFGRLIPGPGDRHD